MFFNKRIGLLTTLFGLTGPSLILFTTTSCGEISNNSISISWEDNINHLDEFHTTIKAIANVNIASDVNAEIGDNWHYSNLPPSISESHNGNSIIFVLDTNMVSTTSNFSLYCAYQNLRSNHTNFSVDNITPINYDYLISLSTNTGTLTQSTTTITITASIDKLNPLAPDPSVVNWNVPNHSSFFTHSINGNQITFALTNPGHEETIANDYAIQASYNPGQVSGGAATKTFTLKTEDWIYWAPNWIPKNLLSISNTTLNGLITSAYIDSYDTLKIPREIKTIKASAFSNKLIGIKYIDFNSSNVETIGDGAFDQISLIASTFEGELLLPNTLKSLKSYSFRKTGFSDINMSSCNLLTRIDYGAFSECNNIEAIEFNNNLKEFQEPPTSAAGVFEMSSGISKFKGTLTLPTGLQKIGGRTFYQFGNGQLIGQTNGIELNWSNCTQLTTIGGIAFENVYFKPNTTLAFPDSVKSIGLICFFGTHNLKNVVLGSAITNMGANCFSESDVNTVKILKTNGIYQYNFESNLPNTEYSNMNFGKWLRFTNIERWSDSITGPTGSASGAYIEVPQALLSQYQSWPVITSTNQIDIRGY